MKNYTVSVDKDQVLTIRVDLKKNLGKSKTGKSLMVASTSGFVEIPAGNGAKLSMNVITKEV